MVESNLLRISPQDGEFEIIVTGFDRNRDLFLSSRQVVVQCQIELHRQTSHLPESCADQRDGIGGIEMFDATIDLSGYQFPESARIVIEAYRQLEVARFEFGTVGAFRSLKSAGCHSLALWQDCDFDLR